MKTKLLISGCFCGQNTKYNGGNNLLSNLKELEQYFELYPICPEVMGGLPTPREPSEIQQDKVFSRQGVDVTQQFLSGANSALKIAQKNGITLALLKEASPSCGVSFVYDGSFSGRKIFGIGKTAQLLRQNGILTFSENELEDLFKIIHVDLFKGTKKNRITFQREVGNYTLLSFERDPGFSWRLVEIEGQRYSPEHVYDMKNTIAIIGQGNFVGKEIKFIE